MDHKIDADRPNRFDARKLNISGRYQWLISTTVRYLDPRVYLPCSHLKARAEYGSPSFTPQVSKGVSYLQTETREVRRKWTALLELQGKEHGLRIQLADFILATKGNLNCEPSKHIDSGL